MPAFEALSDKVAFPNYLRTTTSSAIYGFIFTDLCVLEGFHKVGVVVDWSSASHKLYAQPSADVFIQAVADSAALYTGTGNTKTKIDIVLAYHGKIQNLGTRKEEINQAVRRLLVSGVRVVYAAFSDLSLFYELVCATHLQLVQHSGPNSNGMVRRVIGGSSSHTNFFFDYLDVVRIAVLGSESRSCRVLRTEHRILRLGVAKNSLPVHLQL
jgi:hypothetical protein